MTYPMHFTDNANSWRRMLMLARLYWPGMKPGMIIVALAPLAAVFIAASIAKLTGSLVNPIFQWPISFIIYLSPIMLTRRDYRDISSQLPVTAAEKIGFLVLTFWIAVPLLATLSSELGELLSGVVYGTEVKELLNGYEEKVITTLNDFGIKSICGSIVVSYINMIAVITVILYYVVKVKKNRVLAAFLSYFIVGIATSLVAGLLGGTIVAIQVVNAKGSAMSESAIDHAVQSSVIQLILVALVMMTIIGSIYFVKLYKQLRNRGF